MEYFGKRCCHTNQDAATPLRMVTTTTKTSGYPVVIFGVEDLNLLDVLI